MNISKLILAAAFLGMAGIAGAMPITGSIGFTGDYTRVGGTSLADATGINITGDDATITGVVDGSFAAAGITAGQTAVYNDFTIGSVPIAGLWSIGGFSFDLTNMTIDFRAPTLLALSGSGMLKSTSPSLDDTSGMWNFTANTAGTNFTFSSSSAADAVPEPNITMLLAVGLIGLGLARKLGKSA